MDTRVIWSARDWADAVTLLPVAGPLPCRTVLVPRESVAHVLRRELTRADRADALAGTRFVPISYTAVEVLRAAGVEFEPGEEALRAARLMALFRSGLGLGLGHFSRDLLRDKPGWDDAFAHTISDFEGAGLRPTDIEAAGASRQLRDVATVWRALDESQGRSWTNQRIYIEAALALERRTAPWPFPGAVLAFAAGDITGAEARFVRAIPRTTVVLLCARPARERYLGRMTGLLGERAGAALRSARAPRSQTSERDLLASFLFEPPSVLADESRPRSAGPDKTPTVELEEHAGVEAEVEATAEWVARQVIDQPPTPLEEVAVLLPTLDPLACLVASRLARLPWQGGQMPVYVAGGLPLAQFAGGARALAVVRALRAHLAAESLGEVLPALRSSAPDGRHLTHRAATDLVWSLGTVGGNPANPRGALEWSERAKAREAELWAELARARVAGEADGGAGRRACDIERLVADLGAIRPALDALGGVARRVADRAGLAVLWPALRDFLAEWLLQPGEGPRVHALLDDLLGSLASDAACGALGGDDGLRVIEERAAAARVPTGRFGEPAVYVGSLRDAVGLRFRAVRVIGLAEGHLPSVSREDPVVPDVLREGLAAAGASPPTAADRALHDLHALDWAVRNADRGLALSAARLDTERSQREPSSVILEAAAAVARPNRATGKRTATIPDAAALRRDWFAPAREDATGFRRTSPLGEASWQDGVASRAVAVPPRWRGSRALDLDRVLEVTTPVAPGPMDGLLGAAGGDVAVPGLAAEWPVSPSALEKLLGCPYAFLLGAILDFGEPAAPPPRREIGQPHYGSFFHQVAAEFYDRHGASFCAREGTLDDWLLRANGVADRAFAEFLNRYPLVGEAVRDQQRERLRRDLRALLQYDWDTSGEGRRFVAAERGFGRPKPIRLPLGARALFLRGRVDWLCVEGRRALVRDLKTGGAHRRDGKEKDPDPGLDLQIALYGLIARILADEWKIPKRIAAAYAYVGDGRVDERSYRDDFHEALEPAARRWLEVAAGLLDARLFPRTSDKEDCKYCRFRPVCGDGVHARAAEILSDAEGVLADFGALKGARDTAARGAAASLPAEDEED